MKHTAILLLTLGCSAAEGECGGLRHSQMLAGPEANECMIVEIAEGSDGLVGVGDECPFSRCAVLQPGDTFQIWKRGVAEEPEFNTATLDLIAGECRLSCAE